MKMGIATKMMLWAALAVVCVVPAMSLVAYGIARSGLEKQINSHLESVAQSRAAHVETFLQEHREAIRTAATSVLLARALRNLEADGADAASIVQGMNVRLQLFLDPGGAFYDMSLLDRHGTIVASTNPDSVGLDKSTNAYFVGGREGLFIKDAYHSTSRGRDSLAFSAPMYDRERNELLGVLVARCDLTALNAITCDRTGLGQTGETYLINKDGFMITTSRFLKDTFLKRKVDSANARACLAHMEATRRGETPPPHEHEAAVFADYRGVDVLGAHAHVPEMQWGLLAEIDADEAFRPMTTLRAGLLVSTFLLMAIALTGAWLLSRRICGPIQELRAGAERIGGGDLGHRMRIQTGDEIELLALAFDRMAASLSQSRASLERNVADRTRELAAERERLQVTLSSIGDAVIAVDMSGKVSLMNKVAETLTGYSEEESIGRPLPAVFNIVNERTRQPAPNPVARVLREGKVTGLANHTALIARDGVERAIADSAAPITDEHGETLGVVLVFRDVTQEREAQKEVRRLAMISEQAAEGILVTDLDGNITFVNDAWAAMHGYEREELIGKHPSVFYTEERADTELLPLTEKARLKGHHAAVIEHLRKDGTTFPTQMTSSVFSDEEGAPIGMVDFATDITERMRAEGALRASENRYRTLLENLPQKIFLKDNNSVYLTCNENFAADLGITPAQSVGKTDYDFFPRDLAEKYRADDKTVIESGEAIDVEEAYIKDGREMIVNTVKVPVKDESGHVTGVLGIFWDITERKRAEEALRESRARFQTLVEQAGDAIFVVDMKGRILDVNSQACESLGYAREELVQFNIADVDIEVVSHEHRERFWQQVTPGHPTTFEGTQKRKDGTTFPVEVRLAVLEPGPEKTLIGLVRDITERKAAEQQVQDYAGKLESLNAEFQRSNRDLREFTYTVSHDLQEPLRKIHTFGQFLEEDCGDDLPAEGRDHLHRMQDAAIRMRTLIRHLLDLARVGTRGGELVPVPPRQVIDAVLESMSHYTAECGAKVTVKGELPSVRADAVQLEQVFQNLLGNALKFRSPERVPQVTIEGRAEGELAVFSVADNGIGIEERFLKKVFGIFQRLHTREEYEGAGVGLALCEKIIHRHSGTIWVDSEPGKGSTFYFTLPIARGEKEGHN